MNFDKFIEKDIIDFLDKKADEMANKAAAVREEEFDLYEITEDYSKEINDALRENDLLKAQRIFEEVKNRYLQAPDTSANKKRWYMIMEEVYEKIKDYENKEEGKKNLFETIREYEQKGLFSKPELFVRGEGSAMGLILSSISLKDKQLENITARSVLTSKDLGEAINLYREMKELIKRIPNSNLEAKAKASERALSWYYTIRKLKQNLVHPEERKAQEAREEAQKNLESRLADVRRLKAEIIATHNRIADNIRSKALKSSIMEYKKLRTLCEEFPSDLADEKTALLADALAIYDIIIKLKEELEGRKVADSREKQEQADEQEARGYQKQDIIDKLSEVKAALISKDAKKAIKSYAQLKGMFKSYPEDPIDEKKKLYDEILQSHRDIIILENDLKRKSLETASGEIVDIRQRMKEASELIDKKKVDDASNIALEVKHRIELLPKEEFDEKAILLKEEDELEHKIIFSKNIQSMDNAGVDNQNQDARVNEEQQIGEVMK
jgi:hypothetical protein